MAKENKLSLFNDEIIKKNKIIEDTIKQLKKEFVGIDSQIEEIMNNMKPWFFYPELQSSPIVINVFGMTGVGKTSLLRRIVKLLDREEDFVYFNFAEIGSGEVNSYEIEQKLEDELSNDNPRKIFCYDEFQFASMKKMNGEERDNKTGLKPFWELLDTGIIHKRFSYWLIGNMKMLVRYLDKIDSKCPIVLKDGVWVNERECMSRFSKYELGSDLDSYINIHKFGKDGKPERDRYYNSDEISQDNDWWLEPKLSNFIIESSFLEKIASVYKDIHPGSEYGDKYRLYNKLKGMSINDMCEFIDNIARDANKGYDLNFNESIIFVIANVDEAYQGIASNLDPDYSADQFYELTKKISTVDIKKALEARFRDEQIARLGNINVIYPSFSSKSFRKIIELTLERYAKDVKKSYGMNIEYDDSIKDLLYDESVFPTQGTRPIFSSIHEMIRTKLPDIAMAAFHKKINDAETFRYSYDGKEISIDIIDKKGKVKDTIKFKPTLRVHSLRKSKKDEKQALVAVHESGHFVMYAKYMGKVPEKLCSQTTSNGTGGFMMKKISDDGIYSKRMLLEEIDISLGGYVAELIAFGKDERTNGASSDLSTATSLASKMVRKWGLGSEIAVSTYLSNGMSDSYLFSGSDQSKQDEEIRRIINDSIARVENTLKSYQWRKMWKASAEYLSEHSTMEKEKMEEIYHLVSEEERKLARPKDYYRNLIAKL